MKTKHVTDVIEEFWLLTSRRVRHIRSPPWRLEVIDNRHRAKLPKTSANIVLSGQNGKLINGWAPKIPRSIPGYFTRGFKHSSHHRKEILESEQCGCFYFLTFSTF